MKIKKRKIIKISLFTFIFVFLFLIFGAVLHDYVFKPFEKRDDKYFIEMGTNNNTDSAYEFYHDYLSYDKYIKCKYSFYINSNNKKILRMFEAFYFHINGENLSSENYSLVVYMNNYMKEKNLLLNEIPYCKEMLIDDESVEFDYIYVNNYYIYMINYCDEFYHSKAMNWNSYERSCLYFMGFNDLNETIEFSYIYFSNGVLINDKNDVVEIINDNMKLL